MIGDGEHLILFEDESFQHEQFLGEILGMWWEGGV
jgi:hypothetical protein